MNTFLLRTLLEEAWTHNQTLHTYDHAAVPEELLNAQTSALRRALDLLQIHPTTPTAPAAGGKKASTVDWMDVDVLPEEDRTVLVACDDGEVDAAFYLHEDNRWYWLSAHPISQTVIAWCEMPEAPVDTISSHVSETDLRSSLEWCIRQLEGDSGASVSYWEEFPEYHMAVALIRQGRTT